MKRAIFVLILIAILLVFAGCKPQKTETGGIESRIGTGEGTGEGAKTNLLSYLQKNARCKGTLSSPMGKITITAWIKEGNFKLEYDWNQPIKKVVKNGDVLYFQYETGQCVKYNMKEAEEFYRRLGGEQQREMEEIKEKDETIKQHLEKNIYECVENVVTDADVAPLQGCEDIIGKIKQSFEMMCNMCKQFPQQFGGDCSKYCFS